ncbi:MAG TPA: hypothetical protein VGR76_10975, partial [Candidatus Angelobacter sp.]|nr:hypothetical protein [Candidatus Angelobacter sp.]
MILRSLSSMWTALAPSIGNHLWQSTLFAAAAGLLALALSKNHARALLALAGGVVEVPGPLFRAGCDRQPSLLVTGC